MTNRTQNFNSFDAERINQAAMRKVQLFLAELQKSPHHEFARRYWYAIAYTHACGKIYTDKIVELFQCGKERANQQLDFYHFVQQHQGDKLAELAKELEDSLANKRSNENQKVTESREMTLRVATAAAHRHEQLLDTTRAAGEVEFSALSAEIGYWDVTFRYILESSTTEDFSKSIPERLSGAASAFIPPYSLFLSLWTMVKPPSSILRTEAGTAALEYLDGYIVELNRYAVTAILSNGEVPNEAEESALEKAIDDSQTEVNLFVNSYFPQELFRTKK